MHKNKCEKYIYSSQFPIKKRSEIYIDYRKEIFEQA